MLVFLFFLWPFNPPFEAMAESATVGVLAHRGNDAAQAKWQETIAYLNANIAEAELTMLPLTLEGVEEALADGMIDFLVTNPGHFRTMADRHRLTRIASLRTDRVGRSKTGNRYGAVILARADRDDIKSLIDLKGKSFAAVAPEAFGGFLVAAHTLRRNGIEPHRDLKAIVYTGFPQDKIVDAVLSGETDAGTVRTGVLESMIDSGRISATAIKVLNRQNIAGFSLMLSTDVFPEWTFAASPSAPDLLRRQVASTLLQMPESSAAAIAGGYGGWDTPLYDGKVRNVLALTLRDVPATNGWSGQPLLWMASFFAGIIVTVGFVFLILFVRRQSRTGAPQDGAARMREDLTPRETEVLELVMSGMTSKEIARTLSISPKTVEFHRRHLMEKFDAHNVVDLICKALGQPQSK